MSKYLKEDSKGMDFLKSRIKEIQSGSFDAHVVIHDDEYDNGSNALEVAYYHEFGTVYHTETAWLRRSTSESKLQAIVRDHEREVKGILESKTPDKIPKGLATRLEQAAKEGLLAAGLYDTGTLYNAIEGRVGPPQGGE